jgi:hypothetical protein
MLRLPLDDDALAGVDPEGCLDDRVRVARERVGGEEGVDGQLALRSQCVREALVDGEVPVEA